MFFYFIRKNSCLLLFECKKHLKTEKESELIVNAEIDHKTSHKDCWKVLYMISPRQNCNNISAVEKAIMITIFENDMLVNF